MNYIFINLLFFKLINTFNPFFSGLFQNYNSKISYKNNFLYSPNTIIEGIEQNCSLILNECKTKIIIPGYMDHEPKIEAFKNFIKNKNNVIKFYKK